MEDGEQKEENYFCSEKLHSFFCNSISLIEHPIVKLLALYYMRKMGHNLTGVLACFILLLRQGRHGIKHQGAGTDPSSKSQS